MKFLRCIRRRKSQPMAEPMSAMTPHNYDKARNLDRLERYQKRCLKHADNLARNHGDEANVAAMRRRGASAHRIRRVLQQP